MPPCCRHVAMGYKSLRSQGLVMSAPGVFWTKQSSPATLHAMAARGACWLCARHRETRCLTPLRTGAVRVQVAVVLAWLGLLAVGIAGAAQMRLEPDVNNFIPDGSYLQCASSPAAHQCSSCCTPVPH